MASSSNKKVVHPAGNDAEGLQLHSYVNSHRLKVSGNLTGYLAFSGGGAEPSKPYPKDVKDFVVFVDGKYAGISADSEVAAVMQAHDKSLSGYAVFPKDRNRFHAGICAVTLSKRGSAR